MRNILFTCLLLLIASHLHAQKVQQKLPEKTRILFLLDGSGSMLAKWGDTDRISTAKALLSHLVDSLKVNPKLELALRAYGHLYSRQSQNCKDTKLEVGFAKNNHTQIIKKLELIKPKGTTPIAYSLEQAGNDFPQGTGYRNIVIIITDGIESCDGDPCAVSLALQKKNIFLKPFIIGIGMQRNYKERFACIGEFYSANDISSFQMALQTAVKTSLDKTTVSVELLDANNRPTETNVNVSFINNFTGESAFDFVHYRDKNGRPDSVEIDAVLSYDIVVNTIPPVVRRNVNLKPGTHNVLEIPSPQGNLQLSQKGSSSYKEGVMALIKEKGRVIHVQPINTLEQYLVGTYDVEVLTVPKMVFKDVKIGQSQTTRLGLETPGIVNIKNNAAGYGSIYQITKEDKQLWVYDLDHNSNAITIALQPGKYKIVFRVEQARGSKFTSVKEIIVKEGLSTAINLF